MVAVGYLLKKLAHEHNIAILVSVDEVSEHWVCHCAL